MKLFLLVLIVMSNLAICKQSPSDAALTLAAASNDLEGIKRALQSGADINSTTIDGRTPLIHAAILGRENAVRLLIQNKADLNHRDISGQTALMYAVVVEPKVAIQLITAGADVKIKDNQGGTALLNTMDPVLKRIIIEAGGEEIRPGTPSTARAEPASPARPTASIIKEPAGVPRSSSIPMSSVTPPPLAPLSGAGNPSASPGVQAPANAGLPGANETRFHLAILLSAALAIGGGLAFFVRRSRTPR
jgi:hypothetical protein